MTRHGAPSALPWWLAPAARLNLFLLRRGLRIGTQHILTVRGRRTGRARSTVVSVVTVDGVRHVVSGEGLARNARAAGVALLERANASERVRLVELPANARADVLRAFWHQVPQGRSFICSLLGLSREASADDFAAAAPRCPVFRIEPLASARS